MVIDLDVKCEIRKFLDSDKEGDNRRFWVWWYLNIILKVWFRKRIIEVTVLLKCVYNLFYLREWGCGES